MPVPPSVPQHPDTIVIGGGQAGLAAAYYLRQRGLSFVVLDERPAVGDVWASRFEALRLFSPAWASALPGLPWPGSQSRYPTKDEAAAYLQQYATHFQLPIEHNQRVTRLRLLPTGGYEVLTAAGSRLEARRVIVCTGPYTAPAIPEFAALLPPAVQQLHSRDYQRPAQVAGTGPVAVVGSGNSALQIAADLAATGRRVYVGFDESTPAMPNNTLMWLFLTATGLLRVPGRTWLGRYMQHQPEPVVRQDLQRLRRFPNARFIGRAQAATPGGELRGAAAPTPPLEAVVWATGFRPGLEWLQVPGALDAQGRPLHQEGISPVPGLAFLGLPWLSCRRSALMGGAGPDARHVVERLTK